MAAEGVEDVGGAGEVEYQLGRAGVRDAFDLRGGRQRRHARKRSIIVSPRWMHTMYGIEI